MKRYALILSCVLLGSTGLAQSQGGPISQSRRINWSFAGVPGGIPRRTDVCANLSPGATAQQITAAISTCPSGQVVMLAAGTYNLSTGIRFNGRNDVTLRGAGPDKTFLVFASSDACMGLGGNICVNGRDMGYFVGSPLHSTDWTSGYAKGTTQITLGSTTGLSVGMPIVLDQLNDMADTGGAIVCSVAGTCADEGPGGAGRPQREQQQIVIATAINGTTVTISPGLHMPNWRSSQQPSAFWGRPTSFISGAGVEDLSLDSSAAAGRSGIYFIFAVNSWVRNVRSLWANRNHVWFYQSARNTVKDSYFYGTKNAGSQSYGIEEFMGFDNLIENNILHHIASPLQTNGGSGSVFAYNYSFDNYYRVSPAWQQASSSLHAAGVGMILHEGNEGTGFVGDSIHGSHNFVTAFRNYFTGWEPGKAANTNPVKLYAFNRYMNFIGNVLGTETYHLNYEWTVSGPQLHTSVWSLGAGTSRTPSDALVKTTLMRWGNYDTVTKTTRFLATEVPANLAYYSTPVPVDNSLPRSLYLSDRPSWWDATIPWPAIGPDVSGGSGPGGHAHKIPAHMCYDSTPQTGGILNFGAVNCYDLSPEAPRNFRITSPAGDTR